MTVAADPDTAPLARHLRRLIAMQGPLTVAQYMAAALTHPRHGYYMGADPLGAGGDFTTAPEISQMFGELIGLWCADCWRWIGAPERVLLAELGPGRGTLIADALRAVAVAPDFRAAVEVHLIEASPVLRAKQQARLETLAAPPPLAWHHRLADLPDGPLLLIANEFFDALPVHQLVATPRGWRERLVDIDRDGGFRFVLAPGPTPAVALMTRRAPAAPGSCAEICPSGLALAGDIGARLVAHRGAALIVDFGAATLPGASLQAVRGHRRHDPLADPGTADLAAHVDFAALAQAAREAGAAVHGPVTQGAFLTALGLPLRAARLIEGATGAQADDIRRAGRRLTAAGEMGELFKVLAITDPELPAPAGLDAGP